MFTLALLLFYCACLVYVSCSQGWDIFSPAHRHVALVSSARQKREISQQLVLLFLSLNHGRVVLLPQKTVRQARTSLDLDALSRDFACFEDARAYARGLNLSKFKQWEEWTASGERPDYIPSRPDKAYKTKGWLSWADWLGYGKGQLPTNVFWDFADARDYARSLNLTSKEQWQEWRSSGARPDYIPSDPYRTYQTSGWVNWPDWMGYAPRGLGSQATSASFNVARDYARSLNFTCQSQWLEWSQNGSRPNNIPLCPQVAYKKKGWLSWPDWLGYGKGKLPSNVFWDFADARDYVRSLNFTGHKQWQEWSASGERPDYIPSNPHVTYQTKGWLSEPDWLGHGKGQLPPKAFWQFSEAREFARSLNFTSPKQWKEWSASEERPDYIPSRPDQTYKTKGWLSWPDWLGYDKGRLPSRTSPRPIRMRAV